jgi:hypothetical protein
VDNFRFYFAYCECMFYPDAGLPRPNRTLIYLGACVIAGLRLAREKQVNVRVRPTGEAIDESVDLAHEIFNRVFRKTYRRLEGR